MFKKDKQNLIQRYNKAIEHIDAQINQTEKFVVQLQNQIAKYRQRRRSLVEKIEKLRNEKL